MILSNIRRILKEDLSRLGDTPAWLDAFLNPLNQFIDTVTTALRNNITFKDNFSAKEVTLQFTHATPQVINPQSSLKVKGIIVVDTGGQVLTGYGFTRSTNGSISVTLNFSGGAGTKATCVLEVLLG